MPRNNFETILEQISSINEKAVRFDGYDSCILGICYRFGMEPVLAYDRAACIQSLVDGGMNYPDAEEYFEFNTEGCWAGKHTPVFIDIPS